MRGIRRWDLVAFGVNFIIGAGIFGLPSKVFALAGPVSLLVLLLCAAATGMLVLSFAEVASRYSRTGGPYLYALDTFGSLAGFQVAWTRWLASLFAWSGNAVLLVTYLGYLIPALDEGPWRYTALVALAIPIATINVLGVRDTVLASNILALSKLLPMSLFAAFGLFHLELSNFAIREIPGHTPVSSSALALMYAFTGFESLPVPAGEVHDPQRNVPFALLTTIGMVTLLYLAIQTVCIGTLPGLASSERPLADAAAIVLGRWGGVLLTAAAVCSIGGNLHGQLLANSRLLFAMAEQGQLGPALASTHPRFRTPHVAVLLTAALCLTLALTGTFMQLITISVLARLVMYIATAAALPVLRRRHPDQPPPFRLPAGPWIASAGVLVCFWLLAQSTAGDFRAAAIGAALGLPFYFYYSRRTRKSN